VGRRGKYLLFRIADAGWFVVHLRMTGRLVWRGSDAPPEPYERAKLTFDNGHDLRWSDLRKFGTWRFLDDLAPLLAKLGPEPIDETFTWLRFHEAVSGRAAPIKAVLLDQRRMSGLGNIYVDEALFRAGVRPDTGAADVSVAALKRLHAACREVLETGIANRGASFKDYVDGEGRQGSQHMHVLVFRRNGKPCYRCGTNIERSVVAGRGTHFCPKCQPRPRRRAI
jgi:formamidopyrimidine-DNA glycosylase